MAYEAATASNIADLFTKLSTFAVADGWTEDHADTDRLFLSKGTSYVAFRWAAASPTCAGVYHALGFINGGTDPGNHTGDSGQGMVSGTNATLLTGRHVPLVDTTMPYWFFSDTSPDYIHVVVQVATGDFRHFGFGTLEKQGTYTGGEYAYGWKFTITGGTGTLAVRADSSMLLDGLAGLSTANMEQFSASIHLEGLPNEGGSSDWGIAWGGSTPASNDRGGNARVRVQGGFRAGPEACGFARLEGTLLTGLVPFSTLRQFYKDPSNARWYPLGTMPGVRACHMGAFVGGQEVAVGAQTWVVFPAKALTSFSSTANTRAQGIAYFKNP